MPRLRYWFLSLLLLGLADVGFAQFDPFSLGAGLLSQVMKRRKARGERKKMRRKQKAQDRRIKTILEAINSDERSRRGEGLQSLMTLSQEVRNGDIRLQSRTAIDQVLDRVSASKNPKVRRYAEVIRQNLDLARDPSTQDTRMASLIERWRSPEG